MEKETKGLSPKGEAGLWVLGALIGAISMFIPMIWWMFNPEFTSMQIFYKFWYIYVPGLVFLVIARFRLEALKKKHNVKSEKDLP